MKALRFTALTLLGQLMALAPICILGQELEGVTRGDRVKITYDSNGTQVVMGLLHDALDDAFLVAPSERVVVAVPRDQVTDFRVFAGSEGRWREGLVIGTASGAVAGALLYLVLVEALEETFGGEVESSPGVLTYAAVGALHGGGIGVGIGFFLRRDRWESVPLPNALSSGFLRNDRRIDVGVYIRLGR